MYRSIIYPIHSMSDERITARTSTMSTSIGISMGDCSEEDGSFYYRSDFVLLHLAATEGHVESMRLLATNFGVGPTYVKNNNKLTPFHLASSKGYVNVLKLLVSRYRPRSE